MTLQFGQTGRDDYDGTIVIKNERQQVSYVRDVSGCNGPLTSNRWTARKKITFEIPIQA